MRTLLSVSILALLATASAVHAEDWFRLYMSSPIHFGSQSTDPNTPDENDAPPIGGVNDNIEVTVADSVQERTYGDLEVDVFVSGVDGSYSLTVIDHPMGAQWIPHPDEYGRGRLVWDNATTGVYRPTVEVRDSTGTLVVSRAFDIEVFPQLTVSVPTTSFETPVGGTLLIAPEVGNDIGTMQWSTDPSPLPSWLGFDEASGTFAVNTSTARESSSIVLTGIDTFDFDNASTSPFSVRVAATGPDTSPEIIPLADLNDVEPRWLATSAAVTPSGYNTSIPISVGAGAEVSVNNGAWASTGTLSPGQSFRLRLTAPDQGLMATVPVTVGTAEPIQWSVKAWTEVVRTITANTTSANLPTLFGTSWASTDRKRVIINPDVTVSSTISTTPALSVPSTLGGALIVENAGIVAGAGGTGGVAAAGAAGGTGIALAASGVKIINNGIIAGGGGGGGAGGKGADKTVSSTTRDPSSGYAYSKSNAHWRVDVVAGQSTYNLVNYMGVTNGRSPGTLTSTSQGAGNCTYYRGSLKEESTISSTTYRYYEIYRSCTTSSTVTGGAGGAGGKGAAYPATAGSTGSAGASVANGNSGGTGGKGGNYGSAGSAGASGGFAGGAKGNAITGTPATGSVLGTRY